MKLRDKPTPRLCKAFPWGVLIYYVYFLYQHGAAGNFIKIGHTKNPKKRIYGYTDSYTGARYLHLIELSTKKLALDMEKGFCRIMKNIDPYYSDREWFRVTKETKEQLKKWEADCEGLI